MVWRWVAKAGGVVTVCVSINDLASCPPFGGWWGVIGLIPLWECRDLVTLFADWRNRFVRFGPSATAIPSRCETLEVAEYE
jgi:hypothetical protein